MANALIILVRNPVRGVVKTRLASAIGDDRALRVYRRLLEYTRSTTRGIISKKFLFYSDWVETSDAWDNEVYDKRLQLGSNLGERMWQAFETAFTEFKGGPNNKVVIIGSDCMEITAALIDAAFQLLDDHDLAIGPASDGGYYLLGMKQMHPELFENKTWSSETVLNDTIEDAVRLGMSYAELPVLSDIDELDDLLCSPLRGMAGMTASLKLSIIIPARNEARNIGSTIRMLASRSTPGNIKEIIVVDGESTDDTAGIAAKAGVRVIKSRKGRGRQLQIGGAVATGDVLYFLHVDCVPPRGFDRLILDAVHAGYRSGCFKLRFDVVHPILRFTAWFSRFGHQWFRAGDESLFVEKGVFMEAGGYDPTRAIMEDVEIIPRLKKLAAFTVIQHSIISSARRYIIKGIFRLQALYVILRIMDIEHHSSNVLEHFYFHFVK